jgi:hypothetical protein
MKYLIIALNLVAAVWLFLLSPESQRAEDSQRHSQILQLEAVGVINTEALGVYFPGDSFPTARLSMSLSRSLRNYTLFIWTAALLCLINAILIGSFWKPRSGDKIASNQVSDVTSEPAPGAVCPSHQD